MTDASRPRIGDSADADQGGTTPATCTATRDGAEPADAGPPDARPQVREAVSVGAAIGLGVVALAATASLVVTGDGGTTAWWALGTLTTGLALAAAIRRRRPATPASWSVATPGSQLVARTYQGPPRAGRAGGSPRGCWARR